MFLNQSLNPECSTVPSHTVSGEACFACREGSSGIKLANEWVMTVSLFVFLMLMNRLETE